MTTSAAAAKVQAEQSQATMQLGNTTRRDRMREIEEHQQKRWEASKVFEQNAPTSEQPELVDMPEAELRQKYPKFFGTFPYPYMNGSLHLGHAFTVSKIEFATGYERMLGKRALFPVGFHCTGMPIKAAADKLVRELEMFGQDFEGYKEDEPEPEKDDSAKAAKSKVAAKSTGLSYQFQIMESIGVPRSEIKKFADPYHWTSYFPPIAQTDLKSIGARVDWRRSFLTTDINPYYDSFVRWQMNRLHDQGLIKFGERYTIFSPKDGQPCMDHDRASGEGVGPQEYTGIKIEVTEWAPEALKAVGQAIGGKPVYMVAATLRPETMYGQTNCFVGTSINYGLFAASDGGVYLCTDRAARNMAYQGLLAERDQVHKLGEVSGKLLVGTKVKAPLSLAPNSEVYVLPMEGVLANKGTGVVTSVPSDSPDDYQTVQDLRKKAEYYGIKPEWAAIEPIPVLKTAAYGELTAPHLCKELKINSQKDVKQLTEAKALAYKEGFYNGTMIVGDFAGSKVEEAKNKVRDQLVASGQAFVYSEPEGVVMSRSSDECVVALCDQWYMAYEVPEWKGKASKLLNNMNTYSSETRHGFEYTIGWLREWACSRSYGLGSKLPWDQQFLVESLSDSTIYMSYYTLCHLLHASVDGHTVGPLGITAEQMTDEVWDYVYSNKPLPANSPVSQEKADALKREYEYWYPMDVRSSGKDLINNHLSFCIFVHAALFPEEKWPLSMRANGHLLLNGKKMSKSTGNSLTLADAVKKFGADATRLTLADAGDGVEDANFEEYTANASILRLYTLTTFSEDVVQNIDKYRKGEKNFYDKVFENEINSLLQQTKAAYSEAMYKEALKHGLYELLASRDWYRDACSIKEDKNDYNLHGDLLLRFVRIQALVLTPITPHTSEYVWSEVLKEPTSIQNATFPEISAPVDTVVLESAEYVRETVKHIRDAEISVQRRKGKGKDQSQAYDPSKPKALTMFIARTYPQWQTDCIEVMKGAFDASAGKLDRAKLKEGIQNAGLMKNKKAMPWCIQFQNFIDQLGAEAAFSRAIPFDEMAIVDSASDYFKRTLGFSELDVVPAEEVIEGKHVVKSGVDKGAAEIAEPTKPSFAFVNL